MLKILPNEAIRSIGGNVHFIRAAFERLAQEAVLEFAYNPETTYHANYVEHTLTMTVRFRTENTNRTNNIRQVMEEMEEGGRDAEE